jgi:hypothetical protein
MVGAGGGYNDKSAVDAGTLFDRDALRKKIGVSSRGNAG